jgi:hypothetical protein
MLGADVGYLRIRGFSGYTKDGKFETGLSALEAALDTTLANARAWKGLVIDVRLNNGGADPYGIAIARRLTSVLYTAYVEAGAQRSDGRHEVDHGATVGRPADVAAELPRPGRGAHGDSEHQRGGDVHAGAHEPEAEGRSRRRDDAGCVLRRPQSHAA